MSIATLLSQHHHVTAVDIIPEKVEMINNRKPYSKVMKSSLPENLNEVVEMEKILLISNDVLHYREKIYNYFFDKFRERGYDFQVLSNRYKMYRAERWLYLHHIHLLPKIIKAM